MKTLKKAVSLTLALVLLLAVSLTARAVDISSYQYISLSKEPLDMVSIVGVTPAIAGNPEVPVSEIAYLVPDDATLSISLPEGGTYFVGMAMLDFPAGSGDPGYDQPLVNAPLSSDGRYTYIVYDSQGSVMEEFNFITQSYADQLAAQGFSITSTSDGPVDPPPQTEAVFADVPLDAYYAGAVAWAVEKGITNGTGATTFSPDTTCTRAEIITFLWRAAGAPAPEQSSPFTDVDANAYYAQAAAWAAENGMADGSTFSPDDPCTRIMAVEFMWKQAGSPSGPPAGFTDTSSPAVDWAVELGVTNGTGGTSFSPEGICTRAQIATFLFRAFGE